MKTKIGLLLLLLMSFKVNAQLRFGNEWIDFNQSYLKFTIAENSLYRIQFNDLQKAGLAINNPNKLQIFYRGVEIAIRQTESYVEFYGLKNDGAQDSLLYRPTSARANSYQSLYSEFSTYFITVGQNDGKRIIKKDFINVNNLNPEKYHLAETLQIYNSDFSFNNFPGPVPNLQQSYYENGEGWTGGMIRSDSSAVWKINLYNLLIGFEYPKPKLFFQINGRSDFLHTPSAYINNNLISTFEFTGYKFQDASAELSAAASFNFKLASKLKDPNEIYSLSYYKVVYPQAFNMFGQTSKIFNIVSNTNGVALLNIKNVESSAKIYDITDYYNLTIPASNFNSESVSLTLENTNVARVLFITSETPKSISTFETIKFQKYEPAKVNYMIVTHSSLLFGAQTYSDYRASNAGGSYSSKVFDIQELYNQFSYGEHHPMAIRRFVDFMNSMGQIQFLFLIGRPYTFPDFLKTTIDDLVPSIGYPGSDVLLTSGLNGSHKDTPSVPTGRLSVTSNIQIVNYLDKVKEFESGSSNGLWRKKVLHLNGGKSVSEITFLNSALKDAGRVISKGWLGMNIEAISKQSPVEVEEINISNKVNDGLSMITFFGHSSPTITDLNFGFASTVGNGLSNKGKYPFMYFVGCAIGNIFFRYNTLPTDWLLTPNKGAVALIAPSYWSFSSTSSQHLSTFYDKLYNTKSLIGQPIGKIHLEVNKVLSAESDNNEYLRSTLHQAILQGDPAIVIYPFTKPDFQAINTGIAIRSKSNSTLAQADSIKVGIILNNIGLYDPALKLKVKTTLIATDDSKIQKDIILPSITFQDTTFLTFKAGKALKKVVVEADPDKNIDELDENNNQASIDIDWEKVKNQNYYPLNILQDKVPPVVDITFDKKHIENNENVSPNPTIEILLTDDNALPSNDSTLVEAYLKACPKCSFGKLKLSSLKVNTSKNNQLTFVFLPQNLKSENYELLVLGKDASNNKANNNNVSFSVLKENSKLSTVVYPNPASKFAVFEIYNETAELPKLVKVELFSLNGKFLKKDEFETTVGKNKYFIDLEGIPAETIIYRVTKILNDDTSKIESGKIVVLK